MKLAELLLSEDKGWSATKIDDLIKNGPLNNEIAIERKIPMHIAYFTAWVDEQGKLQTYRDVYGHEKRVDQALEGKWDQIAKGRRSSGARRAGQVGACTRGADQAQAENRSSMHLSSAIGGGF